MKETSPLSELDARGREVFRCVVEGYLQTGEPVGSRTLSRNLSESISAATVRNVMQDLELLGLLNSPHVSAGRLPTEIGLRLFVDGLMEVGDVSGRERNEIERSVSGADDDIAKMLHRTGEVLSGLTQSASLVLSPKKSGAPIKHLEFVPLSPSQVLVVMVFSDGSVENRLIAPPVGMTPSAMREASNFLNAVLEGKPIDAMRDIVSLEISQRRMELDELTTSLIEAGTAEWVHSDAGADRLLVRGRANLLENGGQIGDIERVRQLFDEMERKESLAQLLDLAEAGDGVRIFIGSENKLFSLSGSSLVISPYMNADRKIIGAVGVIGPTRLNYGRVVPIVDFTAQMVGKMVSDRLGVHDNG